MLIDSLLDTPYNIVGFTKQRSTTKVEKDAQGVEVELEFSKGKDFSEFTHWSTKADNSLRHIGIEFLFRRPIADKKTLKEAFNEFEGAIKGSRLINSLRTSTHLHHNVGDKTGLDIVAIFGVYWIVEDLLMDFCGESRKGNFNCLSNSQTQATQESLENILRSLTNNPTLKKNFYNNRSIYDIADNNYRYASLNPAAIKLFGSVEFRGMRELTTARELYRWSRIIQCLISYATDRPFDVTLRRFHRMTPKEIVQDIFGDLSRDIIAEGSPDWEDNMIEALLAAQNLKNSLFTWDRAELDAFKKKCDASLEEEKKKSPDKFAGVPRGTVTGDRWVIDDINVAPPRTRAAATGVIPANSYPMLSIPWHVFSPSHYNMFQEWLNSNRSITPDRIENYVMTRDDTLIQIHRINLNTTMAWRRAEVERIPQDAQIRFVIGASRQPGTFEIYYLQWKIPMAETWITLSVRFIAEDSNHMPVFGPVTNAP